MMNAVRTPELARGKKVLIIDVDSTVEDQLARRAESTGVSVSDLARRVLMEWLARTSGVSPLGMGSLQLDPLKQTVMLRGRTIHLSPLETKILAALVRRPGQSITLEELTQLVWGPEVPNGKRTLAVHVCRLREKLGPPVQIRVRRRLGYWLELAPDIAPHS
jgi:hypothetical protein